MTKEQLEKFHENIKSLSNNFEEKAWTDGLKLMKSEFDPQLLNEPNHYLKLISDLEEFSRQTRVLFLYSVFNLVCKEDGKLYFFDVPFQANMKYDAVFKKEGIYYVRDEDGDFREILASVEFTQFIDDLYWKLYEE